MAPILPSTTRSAALASDIVNKLDARERTMTWILVFWLQSPMNYTQYEEFKTERECRDSEHLWNRRFNLVKSELRAECRRRD